MKGNILLVDDETVNLEVLSRRLEREGYLVSRADGGGKALDMLQVQQFDLVILDVQMPGMNGIEVLKHIKADANTKSTPVIMLSGNSSDKIVRKCLLLGAADYLTKPFIMELARNRIETNLRNRGMVTPSVDTGVACLLVDDNAINLELLERMISKLGYHPVTASGGREALQKIHEREYGMVLLDIVMPDISGIDVLTEIRKTYSAGQLPVIMVSAEDDNNTMLQAITEGANDYITRPYDALFLRKRIESSLASQRLFANAGLGIDV